jgi:hypothetical protein
MNAKFSSADTADATDVADVATDAPEATFVAENSPRHKVRRGTISWDEIVVDPRVQRPQNRPLINKIKREFNKDALNTIVISVRQPDLDDRDQDEHVILDGQQRTTGAHEVGYDGPFHAVFHYGLSLQDEAKLFRLLQVRVSVPVKEQFRVALYEGRPDATGIMQVLNALGIKLDPNGGFIAVGVALRIAARPDGLTNFHWALKIIQDVYSADDPSPYDGRLVEALAQLRARHGNAFSTERIMKKLRSSGKTVDGLIGDAKVRRSVNKGTSTQSLADTLVKVFNDGLQKNGPNTLPFWNEKP